MHLDRFNIYSGRICIMDIQGDDSSFIEIMESVKNGEWQMETSTITTKPTFWKGDDGFVITSLNESEKITSLTAYCLDYEKQYKKNKFTKYSELDKKTKWVELGTVDTVNKVGIYDYEYYKSCIDLAWPDDENWIDKNNEIADEKNAGVFPHACVASSGFGSGNYNVYGLFYYDQLYAIKVIFVHINLK